MGASVVAALCGCGALVGVHDLDVVGDGESPAKPDSSAPEKDAAITPVDAGGESDVDASTTPPIERPPPGAYTYTITGSDGLKGSFGTSNQYTEPAKLTITLEGSDCYSQTLHIRAKYEETFHFCRRGPEFVMDTGDRDQTLFNYRVQTHQTCTPGDLYFPQLPVATPPYAHSCTGHNAEQASGDSNSNFTTAGNYTYVGIEKVPVNGSNIEVRHFKDERTVSGSQNGTNIADWFFDAKTGIVVRLRRTIDVHYKFNNIIDTEYVETIEDMTISAPPPAP